MKSRFKIIILSVLAVLAFVFALGLWQIHTLTVAHSSFEKYYAFRGCSTLVERTDTSGTCITKSGASIKIVLYEGRWFLDGDLPCSSGLCW